MNQPLFVHDSLGPDTAISTTTFRPATADEIRAAFAELDAPKIAPEDDVVGGAGKEIL